METGTMTPEAPRLTVEQENALVSQVLEIIGGIRCEALQSLDQPEERDVWSMEEGDDSVFYSDEDQTHQDIKTSCDFGANESDHFVTNEVAEEQQREGDHTAEVISDKESLEMEREASLTVQEEECQELQTAETKQVHQSESKDQTPENLLSPSGESLQPNRTNADMQTEPGQNTSSDTASEQFKEDEVMIDAYAPNLTPSDVTNGESYTRLSVEAGVPKEKSYAELQISGDRQLEVNQEPERDHNFHLPVGFHQGRSPNHSTLPLSMKSSRAATQQKSFDHLTSSKYSTVSYRKIRRGNTRQKIEEFECMIMNL